MLRLNQSKTTSVAAVGSGVLLSSSASTLQGSPLVPVARKSSSLGSCLGLSLQVRASSNASSEGWLESSARSIASKAAGKVAGIVDTVLDSNGKSKTEGVKVQYTGTAFVMKTLDRNSDDEDDASEAQGKHVTVQLVSNEIDSNTGKPCVSDESVFERWAASSDTAAEHIKFKLQFSVPKNFGTPAAILVKNHHPHEFQLLSFSLDVPNSIQDVHFWTNSWVENTGDTEGRVFFLNKACLPKDTPAALKEYREKELQELRGNGQGERKPNERIYDYDVYNDLCNPDKGPALTRPILGGSADHPFPRRLRTGRPRAQTNPEYESLGGAVPNYVPRDSGFDPTKARDLTAFQMRAGGHGKAAAGKIPVTGPNFNSVESIKRAYAAKDAPANDPLFPLPGVLQGDDTLWQTDAEFAREFLAGLSPIEIKLVKEFPIQSKLKEFGDPVSAISAEHIGEHLEGLSVEEALSKKKLFVVDHHDVFLPLVERINAPEMKKLYAARTLMFLCSDETLKVLAIELVLPGSNGGKKNARVFTPPADSSKTDYVWELAKAHAMSNEMSVHQVTNHFARSHAMSEPWIIATHRQLSKMHPIHQLMLPHCRYTLRINATARSGLIAAGGAFEGTFTPGAHFLELATAYYRDTWNFESQALPNDLLKRGMAVQDKQAKEGVKLVIPDYPYAADGLEIWGAMKAWNKDYVDIYYPDDKAVQQDAELQNWWTEFRTVGHADKQNAAGWPDLQSKKNLVQIVTIMQWLCTAQHAAVNFSQFDHAGFMPQHPTLTRRLIPEPGTAEWDELQSDPEKFYLSAISDTQTALTMTTVFEITCNHATEEEYISDRTPHWTQHKKVETAFERYKNRLGQIDELIKSRNQDKNLKNRAGAAGQLPYQQLRPSSGSGLTGMGIPNSVTA